MAKLLFRLRNVPDEEANAVRDLLEKNHLEFYETSAGNWGISTPAIWLRHDEEFERAKEILDEFQQDWTAQQREQYRQEVLNGRQRTFWNVFSENPLKVIFYLAIVLLILYVTLRPFLVIG
jgi:hypothetical protein